MKKYVGIYQATLEKLTEWNNAPKEEMSSGMEEWNQWAETHKDAITEMGAPLGKSMRVTSEGVAEVKNEICGYTIVEAKTHEEAARIFSDNPHVKEDGAWVDVLEWIDMGEIAK